jgi:septal ring factor EnvC (AmiA/AmiB activator)
MELTLAKSASARLFLAVAALLAAIGVVMAAEADDAARAARQAELDAVIRDIQITDERQAELRAEIAALDKDRAGLNQALIDTGKRVQDLETQIGDTEARIDAIAANEDAIRASLAARRDVLAEVLAALQRMGHRPPPALLVRPEDALASVRSAILLGAVVPDLREAADKLAFDLKSLVSLKNEMAIERDRMRQDALALAEERARIEMLIAEKRDRRTASATALADEEKRAAALAAQATNLKDLIARMEKEINSAATAKAAADKAAADNRAAGGAKPASLGAVDRLAPAVSFVDARGLLPMPASGKVVRTYGETDSVGTKSEGISIATRSGAQVSAPSDGWVVYAGPFRSYGQLLIINAGDGYHVLLAGMERIDVQLGQFVLAGEPVATMASPKLASAAAVDIVSTQPVLYIEFRKDGTSIDPAPWWAPGDKKVGG